MIPNFLAHTLFGKREEELKKAVVEHHFGISTGFVDEFKKQVLKTEALIEYIGKCSFIASLDPKTVLESMENDEYGKRISYGMFMTGEKYDDVRGLMLAIVEEYNKLFMEHHKEIELRKKLEEKLASIVSFVCPEYEVVSGELKAFLQNKSTNTDTKEDD